MGSISKSGAAAGESRNIFVGCDISQVATPAAVMDRAIVRRHCSSMLNAIQALGVTFRAHIKSHKTAEITLLQCGLETTSVKLVVSTVAEIEFLLPVLQNLKGQGRTVNILYGVPLPPSKIARLAELAQQLGPGSIVLMVDHPSHLQPLELFRKAAGFACGVFLKVDTGYHRAGLPPAALNKDDLLRRLVDLDKRGSVDFLGLYSHSSLSYSGTSERDALDALASEINGCLEAADHHRTHLARVGPLVISVGASPQVTAIKNFAANGKPISSEMLQKSLKEVSNWRNGDSKIMLELHAGVYCVMDMQQLSVRSVSTLGNFDDEIALSVVAEVISVYNNNERQQPEALVAVGTLGLGREPCAFYAGWAVATGVAHHKTHLSERRLIVQRISQEHSILAWELASGEDASKLPAIPLDIGQLVRLYPNHACVTGAMYDQYLVVDSDMESPTKIQDVWVRARGW